MMKGKNEKLIYFTGVMLIKVLHHSISTSVLFPLLQLAVHMKHLILTLNYYDY